MPSRHIRHLRLPPPRLPLPGHRATLQPSRARPPSRSLLPLPHGLLLPSRHIRHLRLPPPRLPLPGHRATLQPSRARPPSRSLLPLPHGLLLPSRHIRHLWLPPPRLPLPGHRAALQASLQALCPSPHLPLGVLAPILQALPPQARCSPLSPSVLSLREASRLASLPLCGQPHRRCPPLLHLLRLHHHLLHVEQLLQHLVHPIWLPPPRLPLPGHRAALQSSLRASCPTPLLPLGILTPILQALPPQARCSPLPPAGRPLRGTSHLASLPLCGQSHRRCLPLLHLLHLHLLLLLLHLRLHHHLLLHVDRLLHHRFPPPLEPRLPTPCLCSCPLRHLHPFLCPLLPPLHGPTRSLLSLLPLPSHPSPGRFQPLPLPRTPHHFQHRVPQRGDLGVPFRTPRHVPQWARDRTGLLHDLQKPVHVVLRFPRIPELFRQLGPQLLHSASAWHGHRRCPPVVAHLLHALSRYHLRQMPHHYPSQPQVVHQVLGGTLLPCPPAPVYPKHDILSLPPAAPSAHARQVEGRPPRHHTLCPQLRAVVQPAPHHI